MPIYWVGGRKVADDYPDFYDGTWDEERKLKDPAGKPHLLENKGNDDDGDVFTGCGHDGTNRAPIGGTSHTLGHGFEKKDDVAFGVAVGRPNHPIDGPIGGGSTRLFSAKTPFYGLSHIFQVDTNYSPIVLNEIPDRKATVGTPFTYQFPQNTFEDPDGDPLTYKATKGDGTALPSWLTFTADTRTFTGTPGASDVGTLTVRVTADDGPDTVDDDFDIVVSEAPNTAPTLENDIPDQKAKVGEEFSFTFAYDTFGDADGDTLTYTATPADNTELPRWLSFDGALRTFSGTPKSRHVGTVRVKVTASDGSATVDGEFDIVVNTAPTLNQRRFRTRKARVGTGFRFTFAANTFSDADSGDTLTYAAGTIIDFGESTTVAGLPVWLSFNPNSAEVHGDAAGRGYGNGVGVGDGERRHPRGGRRLQYRGDLGPDAPPSDTGPEGEGGEGVHLPAPGRHVQRPRRRHADLRGDQVRRHAASGLADVRRLDADVHGHAACPGMWERSR